MAKSSFFLKSDLFRKKWVPARRPSLDSAVLHLGIAGAILAFGSTCVFAADPEWSCEPAIQPALHVSITELRAGSRPGLPEFALSRISAKNPISVRVAQDYRFLAAELNEQIAGLSNNEKSACQLLAAKLRSQLESFFDRRLWSLLADNDVSGFFSEYQTLFSPWVLWAERRALASKFVSHEKEALKQVHKRLMTKLNATRWSGMSRISPEFDHWSQEWTLLLGREAPGAVRLRSNRVALQVAGMSAIEVEIFMFHELAHLADPRLASPSANLSSFETEHYAWAETLDYLAHLHGENVDPGPLWRRIENAIRLNGLGRWIEANLRSRSSYSN